MLRRAFHLFRAILTAGPVQAGLVDTVRQDGKILGAATWESPNSTTSATLGAYAWHLPDYIKALGWSGLAHGIAIQRLIGGHRPKTPSWYLHAIGVSPEARGMGIASQLLQHRLAIADREASPAYLESSTALTGKLYRRHGFETLRPIPLAADATPYAMWRPPQPTA